MGLEPGQCQPQALINPRGAAPLPRQSPPAAPRARGCSWGHPLGCQILLSGQTVFSGVSHHQADWERHPLRKNIYAQQQCLVQKQKPKGDFPVVLLYNSQMLYTRVFRKTTYICSFTENLMTQKYKTYGRKLATSKKLNLYHKTLILGKDLVIIKNTQLELIKQ